MAFKNLTTAHGRSFPQRAFYPSSIRPTSRDVLDAAFLNWIFGLDKTSADPAELKTRIETDILRSQDRESHRQAVNIVGQVLFGESDSQSGAKTLRMTHATLGRYYRPKTYDAEMWANSLFAHASIPSQVMQDLGEIVETAERRPRNVFEEAALAALGIDPSSNSAGGRVKLQVVEGEGRPPFGFVHEEFGRMLGRLVTSRRKEALSTPDHAEQALADVRRLVEVFVWIYFVQLHANAFNAISAVRTGHNYVPAIESIVFGYITEQRSVAKRAFAEDARRLPSLMYNGSVALNALAALHQATGWKTAAWFDALPSKPPVKDIKLLGDWLASYRAEARLPQREAPATLTAAITEIYDSIRDHYQPKTDREKYPFTVGYGVPRDLGTPKNCHLMKRLGGNRGTAPMIDMDLVMLFARARAGHEARVRLIDVFEAMDRVGIRTDDTTRAEIRLDLEIEGKVRALSDSGEAIYVEVR